MTRFLFHLALACAASALPAHAGSLWGDLLGVTERRIEKEGPDAETANFISLAGQEAWKERDRLFMLTRTYLKDNDPHSVAGAFEVLYRIRGYRPMEWIGGPSFEETYADFFAGIDQAVMEQMAHAISLNRDDVFHSLSLYLGITNAAGAHEALRRIAGLAKDNEQTLICLAWHRDPADMDFLLPYMLSNTEAASSLPYHYRNSYGSAAIPYLRRAASEAKSGFTRDSAAVELKVLEQQR